MTGNRTEQDARTSDHETEPMWDADYYEIKRGTAYVPAIDSGVPAWADSTVDAITVILREQGHEIVAAVIARAELHAHETPQERHDRIDAAIRQFTETRSAQGRSA
jgi:hypothetical protein